MKPSITSISILLMVSATQVVLAEESISPLPAPVVAAEAAAADTSGPHIEFASTTYDFGKIMSGEVVKVEFTFTNTGDALLEISGVYPSCGCTAAGTWTRQVEPGKTGTIPLQFNSGHFMGPVTKTATVACNDKKHPTVMLQFKGTIWKPIDVSPQTVVLTVIPDSTSNAPAIVRVVSGLEEPLAVYDAVSSNSLFAVEVMTNQPGKEYSLLIRAVQPFSQNTAQGTISAKTSCSNAPVINVTAIANVQPALVVMPPQIMVPPVLPENAMPFSISIRNNSATPLELSEPTFSIPGVQVQLKEVTPGRQFTATLTFPGGFVFPTNATEVFTVKTSNPRYPVVKVPVHQMQPHTAQRPAPPLRPPPMAVTPGMPAPAHGPSQN